MGKTRNPRGIHVDIGYIRKGSEVLSQIHGEKCWPSVDKVSPCEEACPIHMDVPSYVIALAQGKFEEALEIVRETNPFPSICGRVCHHPCEDACTRSVIDRPIAIEWLKRFVGEYAQSNGTKTKRAKRTKKKSVAIIGSGPAGLTAAYDLVKDGYKVCVYEALPVAGGMLATGIPEFMLPKSVVEEEIDYIRSLGVEIRTNMRLGKDISIEDLQNQGYDSILLAVGAWRSLALPIPGADLKGVELALPYLTDARLGEKNRFRGTVCVIGGGNVALDAARTALRLGARKVFLACLESRENMPSYEWEIAAAEEEGVQVCSAQAPQKLVANKVGKVGQVVFQKVSSASRDSDGKMSWTLVEGDDASLTVDVDKVIVAIGQGLDASIPDGVGLADNGGIRVDSETMATNVPGLFAAGDAIEAPGTVVGAIAHGHAAARAIAQGLGKRGAKKETTAAMAPREVYEFDEEAIPVFLAEKDRWDMPAVVPKDAVRSFAETDLGYGVSQVIEEAKRCLNCRMCGNCVFGRGQICFETSTRLLKVK